MYSNMGSLIQLYFVIFFTSIKQIYIVAAQNIFSMHFSIVLLNVEMQAYWKHDKVSLSVINFI